MPHLEGKSTHLKTREAGDAPCDRTMDGRLDIYLPVRGHRGDTWRVGM